MQGEQGRPRPRGEIDLPDLCQGKVLYPVDVRLRGLLGVPATQEDRTIPGPSGRHVAERHPGCTFCWDCIREATQCPMCHREGPLIERPMHESVWGEAQ